ncbi:hypothetical protein AAW00_12765 [Aurantiacibacter luteus]|uniref:Uncharacterized protein n=1 Tax=Aurantiacibacter luteus TaxID=1581420 RepID=A0A0G9MNN0_9SPHN|nr:hypothetical protein AAW00_12765 [Aurantiacibacter luteus]
MPRWNCAATASISVIQASMRAHGAGTLELPFGEIGRLVRIGGQVEQFVGLLRVKAADELPVPSRRASPAVSPVWLGRGCELY